MCIVSPISAISLIVAGNIGVFVLLVIIIVVFMIDNFVRSFSVPESAKSLSITKKNDFNFGTVGDWGCNSNTQSTVNNIVGKNIELVLALGDYSYESTANCWLNIVDPIDHKMKITIGNHDDISSSLLNQYMNHFGLSKQFYSFDLSKCSFCCNVNRSIIWDRF